MSHAAATTTAFEETPEYRANLLAGPQKIALLAAAGGLVLFAVLGIALGLGGNDGFAPVFASYLTAFMFWVSIGLGSVFFLLIQYVTGGRWGILLRRPLEANSKTLLLGFFLFLPVMVSFFGGDNSPYWWARHEDHVEPQVEAAKTDSPFFRKSVVSPDLHADEHKKKNEWLFPWFTALRGAIYFSLFGALVFVMNKFAMTAEYDPNEEVARIARSRQKYVASFGLFLFAITLTLLATDWVMSLDMTFTSSMFPVIVFDNAAITAYSVGLITLLYLKRKGHPQFVDLFPSGEQIHLGSLLLAFTLGWTYFNFSQYMLIWIGNLAEEIPYYMKRTRGGWGWYVLIMIAFHFCVPFMLLLFRHVKANESALRSVALGLLAVCFADVMWWINPSQTHTGANYSWLMDVSAWVGVGGVWVWYFLGQLKKHPFLPSREVYLLEAYHHGH